MPLPLTVSCFSKIQTGFTLLVPAHLGSPGKKGPLNGWVCPRQKSHVTRRLFKRATGSHFIPRELHFTATHYSLIVTRPLTAGKGERSLSTRKFSRRRTISHGATTERAAWHACLGRKSDDNWGTVGQGGWDDRTDGRVNSSSAGGSWPCRHWQLERNNYAHSTCSTTTTGGRSPRQSHAPYNRLPSMQDRRRTDRVSLHWPRLLPLIPGCLVAPHAWPSSVAAVDVAFCLFHDRNL